MATFEGAVQQVKGDRTAIKADNIWFGAKFNKIPEDISAGDYVRFEYAEKGEWKNVKGSVVKTGGAARTSTPTSVPKSGGGWSGGVGKEFPVGPLHPDRAIIRQNSLGHAVRLFTATGDFDRSAVDSVNSVIAIARLFEEYSTGELDLRIADTTLAEMGVRE